MPKKPVKWGIKVWVCSDSVNGYIVTFDIYTGADPAMPSYPKGLAHHVVTKLLRPFYGKDIPFLWTTTICPFMDLLKEQIGAVGTARTNRKNFPKFANTTLKPPRGFCVFMYHKELVAVRWTDKRDIHALATVIGDGLTTVGRRDGKEVMEVNCPEIIGEYNSFIGSCDNIYPYPCASVPICHLIVVVNLKIKE